MLPGVRVGGSPAPVASQQTSAAVGPAPIVKGELVATSPPCPYHTANGAAFVNPAAPTYGGTISGIVSRNCLRCHGGPIRNLATYQNLKSYASSGLLMMMIQPGGPMSHFLTPAEAQAIIDWASAAEPR